MKIATYNVWNSTRGVPYRINYIIKEIANVEADIICLQEVCNQEMARRIAEEAGYQNIFFDKYKTCEEGLCILSNVPFMECNSWTSKVNAIYTSLLWEGKKIGISNIHLPWDSVAERERQIVEIIKLIDKEVCDFAYIAGDFNCTDTADVQRFLIGECLLEGNEAKPCWYDLARAYAQFTQSDVEYTMNFCENPRFKDNRIELNARVDRILLRNTYPNDFPILSSCKTFGKKIYEDIGLAASDHYGVVVEIL